MATSTRSSSAGRTWSRFSLLTGLKRQAAPVGSGESPVTPASAVTPAAVQLRLQITHRVGELREDQDLVVGVVHREQLVQGVQLGIAGRVPVAARALLHHIQQGSGVGRQVSLQVCVEQVGAQPLEAALVEGWRTRRRPERRGCGTPPRCADCGRLDVGAGAFFLALVVEGIHHVADVLVLIVDAAIQQRRVLRADGQRQAVLDGVQEDVVAQDVALDRLDEGLPAALQPLEQVGAAEAHQPLARAGQVVQLLASRPASAACWAGSPT